MISDPTSFIRQHTRLQRPPHTPEIELWLADEITPIWKLTEEELGAMGVPPPFWAFAWAGGQGVARWLLDHPQEARGREVLDLATGSGLVAIAAAKCGAASVLGADIDPFCGAAVALNAEANGVRVGFTEADLLAGPPPDVELI
jgi:predicted nicotinamide N-methyase